MTTLWDTTGSAVVKELAAQRRTGGAVLSGVALTLVVVADESRVTEAEEAATQAAEAHPCRMLVVVRRQIDAPAPRLDAEVLIGGRLGPGEAVVMRMYGRLGLHAESVVLPLLAADAPVVAWWHAAPPDRLATDALAVFADRRITDSSIPEDSLAALRTRAEDFAPGDTDLAWTRCTSWRAILASTLDAVSGRRGEPVQVTGGRIEGDSGNAERTAAGRLAVLAVRQARSPSRPAGACPAPAGWTPSSSSWTRRRRSRIHADRRGGATISQPYRPDATVALPERALGDLLSEELRRLDSDEPYREALEAATGVTGLAERSPDAGARLVRPRGGGQRRAPGRSGGRGQGRQGRDPPRARRRRPSPTPTRSPGPSPRSWSRGWPPPRRRTGRASVVLTGGGVGIAVLEQVAALAAEPAGRSTGRRSTSGGATSGSSPRTTTTATRRPPAGPCSTSSGSRRTGCTRCRRRTARSPSPEDAAAWYAGELAAAAPEGRCLPRFDVLLLGIGPEGHTASIFPESPAAHDERPVFAVRDCPKPPPTRVSLGFAAINTADEVWLVVAGEEKAPAVAAALAGAEPVELPAAGVHGVRSAPGGCWTRRGRGQLPAPPGCARAGHVRMAAGSAATLARRKPVDRWLVAVAHPDDETFGWPDRPSRPGASAGRRPRRPPSASPGTTRARPTLRATGRLGCAGELPATATPAPTASCRGALRRPRARGGATGRLPRSAARTRRQRRRHRELALRRGRRVPGD